MAPVRGTPLANPDLSQEEFHLFRDYIHSHSGIYLEEDKLDSLRISLLARATFLGCGDYQAYYRILSSDHSEFVELMGLITINETYFFRFPQQFDVLRNQVLPEILSGQEAETRSIRVWSAGCSTGEEPYSIAITIDEVLSSFPDQVNVQIMGTDVSRKALVGAQQGSYGKRTMMNVPPDILHKYFDVVGERFKVKKRIRDMVDFGYHNLIKEPYPLSMIGTWDVIFCRNVTIYFQLESTKRVVANFYRSLVDGGYLFIGHSETLQLVSAEFAPVEIDGVFLYRKVVERKKRTFDFLGGKPKIELPNERPKRRLIKGPDVGAASALVRESRFAAALPVIKSVLSEDPNNAKAHLLQGFIYADHGRYDDAMAECEKAIAIDPLMAAARYVLGVIHQQRGELREAISEFRRTVYIDSHFALAHFHLATILKGQGDDAGARKAFRATLAAIEQRPDGPWTEFLGGFEAAVLVRTAERGLNEIAGARGA